MRRSSPLVHSFVVALLLFSGLQSAAANEAAGITPANPTERAAPGAMTSLDEAEMAGIAGAQGVVLEMKLSNNIDSETFEPIGCAMSIGTPNACRLGLEFAARTGIWLMLKEYFGQLHIKDLRMDVAFLPGANTGYYDANRFKDVLGNNLLPGANPINQPAIQLRYPGTDAQATYDDFLAYMNVGRTWLEYDAGATPGYDRDTTADSVFSIRIADSVGTNLVPDPENPPNVMLSNHSPAKMRFWGTAYVFGF